MSGKLISLETNNPMVEMILPLYEKYLGEDYEAYRNHVYRVLNFTLLIRGGGVNTYKLGIAAAFHDIGLWVHNTMDYLKPSVAHAYEWMQQTGTAGSGWEVEVAAIILNHHKLTKYDSAFAENVNAFRRADNFDLGIRFLPDEIGHKNFHIIKKEFPYKGFRTILVKRWFKWFFKHPGSPLPMFKK